MEHVLLIRDRKSFNGFLFFSFKWLIEEATPTYKWLIEEATPT